MCIELRDTCRTRKLRISDVADDVDTLGEKQTVLYIIRYNDHHHLFFNNQIYDNNKLGESWQSQRSR